MLDSAEGTLAKARSDMGEIAARLWEAAGDYGTESEALKQRDQMLRVAKEQLDIAVSVQAAATSTLEKGVQALRGFEATWADISTNTTSMAAHLGTSANSLQTSKKTLLEATQHLSSTARSFECAASSMHDVQGAVRDTGGIIRQSASQIEAHRGVIDTSLSTVTASQKEMDKALRALTSEMNQQRSRLQAMQSSLHGTRVMIWVMLVGFVAILVVLILMLRRELGGDWSTILLLNPSLVGITACLFKGDTIT